MKWKKWRQKRNVYFLVETAFLISKQLQKTTEQGKTIIFQSLKKEKLLFFGNWGIITLNLFGMFK